MTQWTVELPGSQPMNLNHRGHWSRRHRNTRTWRRDAGLCLRAARIGPQLSVHLTLLVTPPDRRRRDTDNLVAVLKPIKDAVVDVGIIPDDTPEFVSWEPPVLLEPDGSKQWRLRLVVRAPRQKNLPEGELRSGSSTTESRTPVRGGR